MVFIPNLKNVEGEMFMKKLKNLGVFLVVGLFCLTLAGCGTKTSNVEGKLEDLMAKLYEGTQEPMALNNSELTKDNLKYSLGLDSLDFKEGLVSEPMVGSIAHSVVLVRVNDGVDIEKVKKDIKEKVDPRKWICVGVEKEDIIVENKGNLIVLIMVNEDADKIQKNFQNLK